jgi:hypothetical protein
MTRSQNKRKGDTLESNRPAPGSASSGRSRPTSASDIKDIIKMAKDLSNKLKDKSKREQLVNDPTTVEYKARHFNPSMPIEAQWFRIIRAEFEKYFKSDASETDKEAACRVYDKAWFPFLLLALQARQHRILEGSNGPSQRKDFWDATREVVQRLARRIEELKPMIDGDDAAASHRDYLIGCRRTIVTVLIECAKDISK